MRCLKLGDGWVLLAKNTSEQSTPCGHKASSAMTWTWTIQMQTTKAADPLVCRGLHGSGIVPAHWPSTAASTSEAILVRRCKMRKLLDWFLYPRITSPGAWAPGQAILFLLVFAVAAGPIVHAIWTTP